MERQPAGCPLTLPSPPETGERIKLRGMDESRYMPIM
jgi:hypothetical protein